MPTLLAGSKPQWLTAAAGVASLAAASTLANRDQSSDLGGLFVQLPWQVLGCAVFLLVVTVAHYSSAGAVLRGVSGQALPWRETGLLQLAAAAGNRVLPSGVGGATVNARYLLRRGLAPGATASVLGAMAAVGALVDASYVAAVTMLGPSVGVSGAKAEMKSLIAHGAASSGSHAWLIAAVVAVGLAVAVFRLRLRVIRSAVLAVRDAAAHLLALVTSPGRLTGAAAASMATTAVLGVGFVAAVRVWGQAPSPLPVGALIALYWVGAAAGNATPLPAFLGVTEIALIGGLVVAGYSPASATAAVIVFRVITFWLPVPVGVWAARRLRRARLL